MTKREQAKNSLASLIVDFGLLGNEFPALVPALADLVKGLVAATNQQLEVLEGKKPMKGKKGGNKGFMGGGKNGGFVTTPANSPKKGFKGGK